MGHIYNLTNAQNNNSHNYFIVNSYLKYLTLNFSTLLFLCRCFKGHDESVAAATFTPDSNYFVTGSSGGDLCGELLVWDAQFGHGKFLKRIPDCHDLGVLCCEFSPTFGTAGKLLMACATFGKLFMYGALNRLLTWPSWRLLTWHRWCFVNLALLAFVNLAQLDF